METQMDIFDEQVPHSHNHEPVRGMFTTAADALRFIRGGKATVTVRSKRTGSRFTYRVNLKEEEGKKPITFVSLLVGSDNESSYKYLGHIFEDGTYVHGRKSTIGQEAPGAKAFSWVYWKLTSNVLPEELEIWHEGRCGRCGRKLTVPESIASGFGPECAGRIR